MMIHEKTKQNLLSMSKVEELKKSIQEEPCVVLLIGASGSGKSTLAKILANSSDQIVSSDQMRKILTGDASNIEITGKAFHVIHQIVTHRCDHDCVTIVDATNLKKGDRESMLKAARKKKEDCEAIGILIEADEETCKRRQEDRKRTVPENVIELHQKRYQTTKGQIENENFQKLWLYNSQTGKVSEL